MSRYEDYINRLCRVGDYTPEQAKQLALSKEVKKYYESEERKYESIYDRYKR